MRAVRIQKPERITVLGSGWLLDLPVAEISEMVSEIILVDIVHPPDVIKQAGMIRNIKIVEADVTGGLIENVFNRVKAQPLFSKLNTLSGLEIPDYVPDSDPGLIISLNLLTQLEVLPVRFLKRMARISEDELLEFRKAIQRNHIRFLSSYRSVLITEYEEVTTDKSGEVTKEKTVVTDLPEGFDVEKWTWNFDLKGSDFYGKRSVMRVIAMSV